jgi:nucleotide-binding universal stress UspA family protein
MNVIVVGGPLLGSVGQQCAQHAKCPVVIVRSKADTD